MASVLEESKSLSHGESIFNVEYVVLYRYNNGGMIVFHLSHSEMEHANGCVLDRSGRGGAPV